MHQTAGQFRKGGCRRAVKQRQVDISLACALPSAPEVQQRVAFATRGRPAGGQNCSAVNPSKCECVPVCACVKGSCDASTTAAAANANSIIITIIMSAITVIMITIIIFIVVLKSGQRISEGGDGTLSREQDNVGKE